MLIISLCTLQSSIPSQNSFFDRWFIIQRFNFKQYFLISFDVLIYVKLDLSKHINVAYLKQLKQKLLEYFKCVLNQVQFNEFYESIMKLLYTDVPTNFSLKMFDNNTCFYSLTISHRKKYVVKR